MLVPFEQTYFSKLIQHILLLLTTKLVAVNLVKHLDYVPGKFVKSEVRGYIIVNKIYRSEPNLTR